MRKLVISFVLLAVFALFGDPAIADDDSQGSGVESSSSPDRGKGDDRSAGDSGDQEESEDGSDTSSEDPPPAEEGDAEPEATEPPSEEPTEVPAAGQDPLGAEEPVSEGDPAGEDPGKEGDGEVVTDEEPTDPATEVSPDETPLPGNGSVTICHKDDSSGAFTEESVQVDASADGHDGHGGDVIPTFDHADGHYEGKNHDDAGKALLDSGCLPATVPLVPTDLAEERLQDTLAVIAAAAPNVTICHATNSTTNPYVANSPAAQGVINGHAGHNGPVFQPGATSWGDIIPPFSNVNGVSFAGQNWTAEGRAIYNNGCEPVAPAGPPPPLPGEDAPLCHAIGDDEFVQLSVIANSTASGHAAHLDDIIPPFSFGTSGFFSGLNWDDEGQEIFENGCEEDDDDSDDGDDGDDGDDEDAAGLPDAGGAPLWTLLMGCLLVAGGMAIVSNRQLGARGLLAAAMGTTSAPTRSALFAAPAGRHVKPADEVVPAPEEELAPPAEVTATEPVELRQVKPSGLAEEPRNWKASTLIALGLAGAAIAIRRALR